MATTNLPQRGRAHVLGEQAVNAVKKCLPSQWITREQMADYGVDLIVEIVKGTDVTAITFAVQIKGKERHLRGKPDTLEIMGIKASTINYWRQRVERVMIAAYLAEKDIVVWKWADNITVPEKAETSVEIPLSCKLSEVNWKEFTKSLEDYYGRMLQVKWEIIGNLKSNTEPYLAGHRKGIAPALVDAECVLTIFREATIIEYGGKVGIIDCGRNSQEEVIEWLRIKNVRELEFIAISHIHSDHYGGVTRLLKEADRVGNTFLPPLFNRHSAAIRAMQSKLPPAFALLLGEIQKLTEKETRIYFFSETLWQLPLGIGPSGQPIQLDICFPLQGFEKSVARGKSNSMRILEDQNSICPVFRVSIGKSSFLLPGDATQSVWEELAAHNGEKMRSNGILLPHNGNFRSISKKILDKILHKGAFPAVYQPAKRWGFPQKETFDLVTKKGGVLINVEHRPACIRLSPERVELL